MRIILAFALLTGCASSPAPKPDSSEPTAVVTTPVSEAPVLAEAAPPDSLPEALDRAAIVAGVDPIKPAVRACGTGTVTGTVRISVKVGPDGHPMQVKVVATPDAALGDCVAQAMQRARFNATKVGGSFTFPFVF
jgi:TonB family protein